ncbi:hypothetical protein BC835DRAFT_145666 [Cytidiella melzeri]|nr:hypothetical protein BC835DRAFT_145666 [Cytidiella melzeri]
MPLTKNPTLVYVEHPGHTGHIIEGVHVKVEHRPIDLETEPVNGGVLLKTIAVSSDPYMRYRFRDANVAMFCPPILLNDPVDNFGVGKVVRSEDPNLKEGDLVFGYLAFSEYSVYPPKNPHFFNQPLRKIDPIPGTSLSVYLGPLGLIGTTVYPAWQAFLKDKVKDAKTMFVTSGAGGIGTFLTEYAKIVAPHIKIIASAGTDEKVEGMKKHGVDVAFNYKTEDAKEVLRKHGPIDIYWDNVGGPQLDAALLNFNTFGTIIACGCISSATEASSIKHFDEIFKRSLTVHGFIAFTGAVLPPMATFADDVVPLVVSGKISTQHEHRYAGVKEAVTALNAVHTGENKGKAVVVFSEDD